jgi:glycerol kinase
MKYILSIDQGITIKELKVDGGAAVNDLLMQFQANLIGIPVIRPEIIETTALGAAYLAGLAVKFWSGLDEIEKQWAMDRTFTSDISQESQRELKEGWNKAVSHSKNWESH